MKENKLIKILEALDGITQQEWEGLTKYINHKMYIFGYFENSELILKTLKAFFIKVED